MEIQCDCSKFKAEINNITKNMLGRLVCYCGDCQRYARKLGREDILDAYGGTQLVPVYPNAINIKQGQEYLVCNVLSEKGLHRWSVSCCNTAVANTMAKFPWVGIPHNLFTNAKSSLSSLGEVKCKVNGKKKIGNPPFKISNKVTLKDAIAITPFVIKGFVLKKYSHSPFFSTDRVTPIKKPKVLE